MYCVDFREYTEATSPPTKQFSNRLKERKVKWTAGLISLNFKFVKIEYDGVILVTCLLLLLNGIVTVVSGLPYVN